MADIDSTAITSVDSTQDFGTGRGASYRRWMVELSLAKKRMKDWREKCKKYWDLYHGTSVSRKKNSYNALYANTEILAPSVYNTMPTPDVRRRFGEDDPIGKSVSEAINRSLTFNAETTGFDTEIRMDVLDMLIIGRGISRVRYIPDLVQVGDIAQTGIEDNETNLEHEAQEGTQNEELAWETAPIEHVKWDRYLCGPGRTFKEIPWWAFEHDLTRDELVDRFGEQIGNAVELNAGPDDPEARRISDDETAALFKTAKVYEIWDKDTRTVIWVSDGYTKGVLKVEPDPLSLQNFFPVVDPLRAIEDSDTFEPVPLYDQYKEQAEELDRISTRINKLIDALKARAIYDPSLGDVVAELFRGNDNDLIPASTNIKQLYENGGIGGAIWFAPIERIIAVVQSLYNQREQCKQVIYELTGIADIMRGSTDAQETKGAQDLKVAFGMTRLSRMQRAVQRYIRDLMALQAEIICEKFSTQTIEQMTQLGLPTDAQVMLQQCAAMQQAIMAKQAGQDVPPLPPKPTTWEDVKRMMADDAQRTFRVDIETDSTIAASQQEDAQDLAAVMGALVQLVKEVGPMVQMGILPFEAMKQLMLMTARKFRMGSQVEDAIDAMEPPPPPKQDQQDTIPLQVEQLRQQGKQAEIAANLQARREEAQIDARTEYAKQHAQAVQAEQENALEAERKRLESQQNLALESMKQENQKFLEQMKAEMSSQMQVILQAMKSQTAIEVAEIGAQTTLDAAQMNAAKAATAEAS